MKPQSERAPAVSKNVGKSGHHLPQVVTPFPQDGTELPQGATPDADPERTRKLMASLPRGIMIGQWPDGRRKSFYVRFGKDRAMESYASEFERNSRAVEIRRLQVERGGVPFEFDPAAWREYVDFRHRVKATLPELEEAWNKHRGTSKGALTVTDLIALYKAKRKTAGRSKSGLQHRDLALARFEEFKGDLPAPAITDDTVTQWLEWLPKKYGLGDVAVAGHFSALRAMFNLPAVRKVCRENPCDFVEPPHVEESDEVAVLSLRQAFEFFKANRDEVCIGRLAAEAFAGLRFSSAAKLRLEDLDFAEQGITLPGSKHKSNRRHYVDGFPKNLWRWLKFAPAECWGLSWRNYMRYKGQAFDRARFPNPGNVLRHTMPTMHLSAFKNAAVTATLLQHRNATMLYQRYKGRGVSQAVGRAYFFITPTTVKLPFERFCRLVGVTTPTQP